MKNNIVLSAFVLLSVGTLGLLFNEYLFNWGRTATLLFAIANLIGLVVFGYINWKKFKKKGQSNL